MCRAGEKPLPHEPNAEETSRRGQAPALRSLLPTILHCPAKKCFLGGQCYQLKKIKSKREIKQGRKRKTIDFPHEAPGRRRGIPKGWCDPQRIKICMIAGGNHTLIKQHFAKRPLGRLLWFLSCRDGKYRPRQGVSPVPLHREAFGTVLRPPLQPLRHGFAVPPPLTQGRHRPVRPANCCRLPANFPLHEREKCGRLMEKLYFQEAVS